MRRRALYVGGTHPQGEKMEEESGSGDVRVGPKAGAYVAPVSCIRISAMRMYKPIAELIDQLNR